MYALFAVFNQWLQQQRISKLISLLWRKVLSHCRATASVNQTLMLWLGAAVVVFGTALFCPALLCSMGHPENTLADVVQRCPHTWLELEHSLWAWAWVRGTSLGGNAGFGFFSPCHQQQCGIGSFSSFVSFCIEDLVCFSLPNLCQDEVLFCSRVTRWQTANE